jgi:cell division protein FtsW
MIKMGYLPERSTDYIFSILCEEMGMVGACLLLGLLIVWIWQARKAAVNAADRFGQLLAGSLSFVIAAQALLHIAVNLAVAPPKGIGLPFVSAGGTSMVIMAFAVSIIVSVTSRSTRGPVADLAAAGAAH